MSEALEQSILEAVVKALGDDSKYFNIDKSEVLDEEHDYFSMLVSIKPRENHFAQYDVKAVGGGTYLQVDHQNGESNLMVGEDGTIELELSYGNIYAQLYWGEILEEV